MVVFAIILVGFGGVLLLLRMLLRGFRWRISNSRFVNIWADHGLC